MTGYHYFWISLDINDLVSFISRKWLSVTDITGYHSATLWITLDIIRLPSGYHSANLRISLDITQLPSGYDWISLEITRFLDITGYQRLGEFYIPQVVKQWCCLQIREPLFCVLQYNIGIRIIVVYFLDMVYSVSKVFELMCILADVRFSRYAF